MNSMSYYCVYAAFELHQVIAVSAHHAHHGAPPLSQCLCVMIVSHMYTYETHTDMYDLCLSLSTTSQTHCWDAGTPIEETLHALNDLVRCGKVHYIGVSNVCGWQLQKIIDTNRRFNYPDILTLQVSCISYVCVFFCLVLLSGCSGVVTTHSTQ